MPQTPPTITSQTFFDLGMWLSMPEKHTAQQLHDLLDQDARLPCIALANQYWLIGALTHSLKTSSVWPSLDDELTAYLLEMDDFYRQRSESIKQEAIHVCQLLSAAGIKVVLLKGAANLFNGVASPPSTRFMTDIDLLVREEEYQRANTVLQSHGYRLNNKFENDEYWNQGNHHAPALYRDGGACCVEVHRWILKYTANKILDTSAAWTQAIELPLTDSLTVWQLDHSHQLIHSIAHSEISHNGFQDKNIDLRQLVNAHNIVQRYDGLIDWNLVDSHFSQCGKQDALYSLLCAAKSLLNLSTPLDCTIDNRAKKQFLTCLSIFERYQGPKPGPRFKHVIAIIQSYSSQNIHLFYGSKPSAWLIKGRLLHLKRHLLMATRVKYWKRLYDNLSRT